MKVWFKRVLIGVVALFILAVLGGAIFLLTFDPNAYKARVQQEFFQRYHRTLSINGDIGLSLFPRIGLTLTRVTLSERESTDIFASIDNAKMAVAIWPLMSNQLVVDHISLTGLKARIHRSPDGIFNFQDLMGEGNVPSAKAAVSAAQVLAPPAQSLGISQAQAATVQPETDTPRTRLQVDIAGLELKNAEIQLNDEDKGIVGRLTNLQLATGRITFDQPFDVSMQGRLIGEKPVADARIQGQALLRLDPQSRQYSAQKLNLRLTGRLDALNADSATLQGNVSYNAGRRHFNASGLSLSVQGKLGEQEAAQAVTLQLTAPQLKVDPSRSEFEVQTLSVRGASKGSQGNLSVELDAPRLLVSPERAEGESVAGTVKLDGESVAGLSFKASGVGGNARELTLKEVKLDGTFKQGERLMRMNLSSPMRWNAVSEQWAATAIKGDVKIDAPALGEAGFEFPLIGSVLVDLLNQRVNSDLSAVLNGSSLDFSTRVENFEKPAVQLKLRAQELDIDKLFPVAQDKSDAKAQAAKDKSDKSTKSDKSADKAAPVKPKPEESAIDLTVLDTLNLSADVKVGRLKGRGLEVADVVLAAQAGKGRFDVSNLTGNLYGGTLAAKLGATSKNAFNGQVNLKNVAVGPIMAAITGTDRLTGEGNVAVNLKTGGAKYADLVAGLDGDVQVALRNGAVKGIDLRKALAQVAEALKQLSSGQIPNVAKSEDLGQQTPFASLAANMTLAKGVGTLRRLAIDADPLRITQGSPAVINLVKQEMDVVANVQVAKRSKDASLADLGRLQGLTVPVRVHGPFKSLNYGVALNGMGQAVAKEVLEQGLKNLLEKNLKPAQPSNKSSSSSKSGAGETDPVKNLGETLKGLIGR